MQRIFLFALFLCLHWVAWGQENYEYRYWFDNSDAESQTGSLQPGEQRLSIDLTGLNDALHIFRFQVKDTAGVWSVPISRYFLKMPAKEDCTTYYWFGDDAARHELGQSFGQNMVDVSHLSDGLHLMFLQAVGERSVSSPLCKMFIRTPQTEGVDYLNCVCYVDGQLYKQEHVASDGGVVLWNFDVSDLSLGLHRIQFQVITPSGAASSVADRFFFRTTTKEEVDSMQLVYCMDGTTFEAAKGTAVNGVFHFDVDVASLEDGLHTISYMLSSNTGTSTRINNAFFWKIPVGGYGVSSYSYWLNDKEANAKVKVLDKRESSFSLVSLLPVDSEPIRSSCFQFEVKDGKPMMYAKNDFHIVFYDASNRRVDETKQYVDYNVSQAVEDISDLLPTQTFARPEKNTVKWFMFESAPGDTIAFKASQAVSFQVFTPTGKEILSVSGDKSVVYSGIHTWEEGTHYVAVHDVAGSKPNITLDYMHMDKYDVVSQDVRVVGNGGCSTITFQGNGFRDLYSVDLYTANGDTIHAIDVGHESDASTTVTFDFTNAELGNYNALFHFTEEDRTITNSVTIEEAKDIELATKVSYPSTFLRGSSVTYTVEITNKGNMTAYYVPLYTYLQSQTQEEITHIQYNGIGEHGLFEGLYTDSLTNEESQEIKEINDYLGDDYLFMKNKVFDNSLGDSICVRSSLLFIDIAPNETKAITITLKTTGSSVYAYFSVPKNWNEFAVKHDASSYAKSRSMRKASIRDEYCCVKEKVECYASVMANGAGLVNLLVDFLPDTPHTELVKIAAHIVDCEYNVLETAVNVTGSFVCGNDNETEKNFWSLVKSLRGKISNSGVIMSCLEAFVPKAKFIKWIKRAGKGADISDILGFGELAADCKKAFTEPKPNCPPNPGGGGGSSSPVNSYDPNEIYGYIAPSGSMYVGDEVLTLPYRIEFENDTTFATSAAHTVVVKDTLDATKFDLASYQPTCIKIGDKDVQLKGDKEFVTTVDMRPEINTIAQVEGLYDEKKGIATWLFTSLDPMTMEPTDDIMQGFLPVNYDGISGIGEVSYNISMKESLVDGTEILNRASIVFDSNETIMTPLWVNTIDAVSPTSQVTGLEQQNDSILTVRMEGSDDRSGVWKYEVYAQYGKEAPWWKVGECTADSAQVDFRYYNGIDYGFCVLATDSAGNVETKELAREASIQTFKMGDVNDDDEVNAFDVMLVQSMYLGEDVTLNADAADVNGDGEINVFDAILIQDIYLSTIKRKARQIVERKRKQQVE